MDSEPNRNGEKSKQEWERESVEDEKQTIEIPNPVGT
jgi:hypothetical protein